MVLQERLPFQRRKARQYWRDAAICNTALPDFVLSGLPNQMRASESSKVVLHRWFCGLRAQGKMTFECATYSISRRWLVISDVQGLLVTAAKLSGLLLDACYVLPAGLSVLLDWPAQKSDIKAEDSIALKTSNNPHILRKSGNSATLSTSSSHSTHRYGHLRWIHHFFHGHLGVYIDFQRTCFIWIGEWRQRKHFLCRFAETGRPGCRRPRARRFRKHILRYCMMVIASRYKFISVGGIFLDTLTLFHWHGLIE